MKPVYCRLPIIHWRKLWPSRRQPPATISNREATPIHIDSEGSAVRIRPGHHQSPSEHRHRNRHRRGERRHSRARIRPKFRQELGQHQRRPLLPGEQDHLDHRRQRGDDFQRPEPGDSAGSGDQECPGRAQFRIFRRENQGIHSPFHGGAQAIGATVFWKIPPRFGRGDEGNAGV